MQRVSNLQRDEQTFLQEKFWQLLHWERVKKREKILISALFYSVLVSLIALPAGALFPIWAEPLYLTVPLFLVMTLAFFMWSPWGGRESLRTIFLLDKTLRLQERAVTAWEILARRERRPAEELVLEETAANLRKVDMRGLFKRQLSWHAFLVPPLLLLWMLFAWLDVDLNFGWFQGSKTVLVAQKLKEFSHDLQERAQKDELTESLKMASALEKIAEKGLKGEIGEEKLREDLADSVQGIGGLAPVTSQGPGGSWPTLSKDALSDLKAEVGKFKDALTNPESLAGKGIQRADILEGLAGLSPFKGEIGKGFLSTKDMEKRDVGEYLEKLERGIVSELDRRNLKETRDFLLLMLDEMKGEEAEGPSQGMGLPQRGKPSTARKRSGRGSLPGDQPGSKGPKVQPPPFQARAATHLKGLLGKGLSAGITVRGEFPAKESEVPQEEVITSYQRQIEGELASEQIPKELKETVKQYFLSLGLTENKR
jgi:hypothetical protein